MGASTDTAAALRVMGVRADWSAAPAGLRGWIGRELGSPVVHARTQPGGFSPGVAARLVCADGSRAFVKAAGVELNARTPELIRTEGDVLAALPSSRHRPRLLGRYDHDGWVALLLEDIDGQLPMLPWAASELTPVLRALEDVAAELTPSPLAGARRASEALAPFFAGWCALAASLPPEVDPWVERHLDALIELERSFVATLSDGKTLCHVDVRSDNIVITADRVVLVDWNWVAVGPRWFDTLMLGWEVVTAGGDLDALVRGSPLTAALDGDLVVACIAAGAGTMQSAHRMPPPPGLPTIRAWQRRYAEALTAWTREHTGWR